MKRAKSHKKKTAAAKVARARKELRRAEHIKRSAENVIREAKRKHESPERVLLSKTTKRRRKKR